MKMKTIQKLLFILLFCFAITTVSAQWLVGGGIGYHSKAASSGLTAKGEIEIMENIALSPAISYYFGHKVYGHSTSLVSLDVNGHYYFYFPEFEPLTAYPLAGLNFSSYNSPFRNDFTGISGSDRKGIFGINLGGGARWQLNQSLAAFAEVRYTINGDFSDVVPLAGVLFYW